MNEVFKNQDKIKNYFLERKEVFDQVLFSEAPGAKDKLDQFRQVGNIDLLRNAHTIIEHIIYSRDKELREFAKQEGVAWAQHSIELAFKIEWVQAIRRAIWYFVQDYRKTQLAGPSEYLDFFFLERVINKQIDAFLREFFLSYSSYKEELILEHRKMVEELSVPLIPINGNTYVLPLIGRVDEVRASIMLEKVLTTISKEQIQVMIIDLSSIAEIEGFVIEHLMKMSQSVKMMGCKVVITGIRPDLARSIVQLGVNFGNEVSIFGNLQQALATSLKKL